MREIFETETERKRATRSRTTLMSIDVFAQRYCIGYFENAVILKMGALRANRQRTRVKSIQNFSVMFRVTSESSQIRIERSIILFIMIINTINIINTAINIFPEISNSESSLFRCLFLQCLSTFRLRPRTLF